MNKYIRITLFTLLISSLTACHSNQESQPAASSNQESQPAAQSVPAAANPGKVSERQAPRNFQTANKGKIESVREIPVFSRISEQIVLFAIQNVGEYVKKGQLVARLSDEALRIKIQHCRARLEKAEFQYQAILMGQGYKRDHLDAAPESIRKIARINSGYNEAKSELSTLEHELTYCTITAPVSGYVSKIQNTLYGAARPGEPLFYIVDMDHLKVGFNVLENELSKYTEGARLTVSTLTFPDEQHEATVSAISPVINDNGMIHIEATLKPHPHLMPGMTAFVTIEAL